MKMKLIKRIIILICVTVLFVNANVQKVYARTELFSAAGWTVQYDAPTPPKPYPHLHFYYKKKHTYCLRLDNFQPCDGTGGNKNKVPKHIKDRAMNHPKVKSIVKKFNPSIDSGWVKAIVKPLLIVGAAAVVVLATVNIFTGPIDDVAAWSALMAALNY